MPQPQWLTRVTKNFGTNTSAGRWRGNTHHLESAMLMEAFLLTPYLAIASSLALAATVVAVCYSQSTPRGAGFTA